MNEMNETVKDRLMMYMSHKNITKKALERKCGLSNGYIDKLRHCPKEDKLNIILKAYPDLNRVWLLTGEGSMLIDSQPLEVVNEGNIRYWVDVTATGGNVEFLSNPDEHEIKMIDVPNFRDCTDAVNIFGDSMSPVYKNGEIIILKAWEESFIDYGCCYLIVTRNGNRFVKYLRRCDDDSKVVCVSENKQYDPFEMPKSDIVKMYIVKGRIAKDTL